MRRGTSRATAALAFIVEALGTPSEGISSRRRGTDVTCEGGLPWENAVSVGVTQEP